MAGLSQAGRVAKLRMLHEDAENMRAMVELQWAYLCIANMAFAVGIVTSLRSPRCNAVSA